MAFSTTEKNSQLNNFATRAAFASLHSGFPGDTGASELTGGTPAYARKSITWNSAGSGLITSSNTPTFDVLGPVTITYVGFWTASSGGTWLGWASLGAGTDTPFYAAASTDLLSADAHGLVNGNQVTVFDTVGAVIPTGLTEGTVYFVVSQSGDTFKLATTLGGAAIDLTTDGAGFVRAIAPETFAGQGTFQLATVTIADDR